LVFITNMYLLYFFVFIAVFLSLVIYDLKWPAGDAIVKAEERKARKEQAEQGRNGGKTSKSNSCSTVSESHQRAETSVLSALSSRGFHFVSRIGYTEGRWFM
jgi:hypothetical protein